MTPQAIKERLHAVPEKIREWFATEEVVAHIREIGRQLNLGGEHETAIAKLLLRLEIQDLEPQFFAGELAQRLGIPKERALVIAAEIRKVILDPVKREFSEYGVDIFLLDEFRIPPPSAKPPPTHITPSAFATSETSTPAAFTYTPRGEEAKAGAETGAQKAKDAPLVLHEERALTADAKKETMKGFSLPFGLFKPKPPEAAATPKVTVEAPKTVHYSEYRTNLSSGAGGEFINLETFGKMRPATDSTKEPVSPPEIQGVDVRPSSAGGANAGAAPAKPNTSTVMPVAAPGFPMKESSLVIKKDAPQPLPRRSPESESATPKVEGNTLDLR